MITDPQRARKNDPGDPSVCNVFSFLEIYTDENMVREISDACPAADIGCVECKKRMAQGLKKGLEPIRAERKALEADPDKVKDIMADGNKRSRAVAQQTMAEVREAVKI
jgi:tryptophanyl-tRNA synthetase